MFRPTITAGAFVLILTTAAAGQVHRPRSVDYLFLAGVSDVRATWVNPAGLGAIPEASVMGEITVGRAADDGFFLQQYTAGFNSRGISVSYLRNRFDGSASTSILRVGTGFPIARGALGLAVNLYGAPGDNARDVDAGFQLGLAPILTVAGVVRHIGRPEVGTDTLGLELGGGGMLSLARGQFRLSGEVLGLERLGVNESGYDISYRAGLALGIPLQYPLDIFAAAALGDNFKVDHLHIGLTVGGRSQVGAVGSGFSRNGSPYIDRISAIGVSSRPLMAR